MAYMDMFTYVRVKSTHLFEFSILVLFPLLVFNNGYCQPSPAKIGISKASPNYVNWLLRADSSIVTINLYNLPIDSAVAVLSNCDALLVTGGEDVYPAWYGKEYDTARCTEMNRHRDSLDISLISESLKLKMPIIGVCRGHQILNVCLGGTLIIDIPGDIKNNIVHQCDDYLQCRHPVTVIQGSQLSAMTGCGSEIVTTNHHQAVDRLAKPLVASAYSRDGVVEAVEWKSPHGKSFLLGVQWHPERMEVTNPLSGPVADMFIKKAYEFHQSRFQKSPK